MPFSAHVSWDINHTPSDIAVCDVGVAGVVFAGFCAICCPDSFLCSAVADRVRCLWCSLCGVETYMYAAAALARSLPRAMTECHTLR